MTDTPADSFRYDRLTISLHWLTAILVAALWVLGQTIDVFPRDNGRLEARSVHILLGAALLGVLVLRVLWSKTPWGGRRPARQGLGDLAARGLQAVLLLLLGATILLGLLNAGVRGDAVFTWVKLPPLSPGYPGIKEAVGDLHALGANIVLAIIGLHAAAGLAHHFLLRDNTLLRILPGGRTA